MTPLFEANQGQNRLDGLPLRSDSAMVSTPPPSTASAVLLLSLSVLIDSSFSCFVASGCRQRRAAQPQALGEDAALTLVAGPYRTV